MKNISRRDFLDIGMGLGITAFAKITMIDDVIEYVSRKSTVSSLVFNEGIYWFEGSKVENVESMIIAVHPYFPGEDFLSKDYKAAFNFYAGRSQEPMLTFVDNRNFELTVKRYDDLKPEGSRFFVRTREANPLPIDTTMKGVSDFISAFNPTLLKLVGGYENACLGFVEQDLGLFYKTRKIPEAVYTLY